MSDAAAPGAPPVRPPQPPIRMWRDRALLVVRRGATIPGPACLRCGARGATSTMIVGVYGDRIEVPLCPRHVRDLRRSTTAMPALVATGVAITIAGLVLDWVLLALPGLYLAIGGLIATSLGKNGISLVASEPNFVHLRGVDSRFLERQRRWDDYPEAQG